METRVFEISVSAFSIDGNRLENFNKGERVRNIHRIGARVIFEPVSVNRVAGTFAMDWSEFDMSTTGVREVQA